MSDASFDIEEEHIKDMIDFLETMEDNLTPWEEEFLNSVMKQRRGGTLSPNQRAKLEEIWEKYLQEIEIDRQMNKDD